MPINRPPHGDDIRRLGAISEMLKVSAQYSPNLTVRVNRGGFWKNENFWVETPNLSTPAMTAPTTGARFYVVCLRENNLLAVVAGNTVATNPDLPAIPPGYLPLAAVFVAAGTTKITDDMIYDIRPFLRAGVPPVDHNVLLNRNVSDAHNVASITGLQTALDDKISSADLATNLVNKADTDGTPSADFVFNKDHAGVSTETVNLTINRGSDPDVGIRWNENTEAWEYTNDGTTWASFSTPVLAAGVVGFSNLDTATQNLINGKSDAVHTHDAADIATGTLALARIPSAIPATKIADGTVSDAEFQYIGGLTSDAQTQINGKADTVHNHAATEITSGVLDAARLPSNIDAAKMADGSVSNVEFQFIGGLTSDAQTQIDSKAASSHTHDATHIASGTLDEARLPSSIDATKIADGTVSDVEFQYIGGLTSDAQTQINGKAATSHTHVAADVTDFATAAKTAAVSDTITDAVTDVAPSQNAVFDALVLKQDASGASLNLQGQGVAPATPAAGTYVLYVLSGDGKLYIKDDTGSSTVVGSQA